MVILRRTLLNFFEEICEKKLLIVLTPTPILLTRNKLKKYAQSLLLGSRIEPVILRGQLSPAFVIDESLVVRDATAGVKDGIHRNEIEGSAHPQGH